jgi:hypothetical protein
MGKILTSLFQSHPLQKYKIVFVDITTNNAYSFHLVKFPGDKLLPVFSSCCFLFASSYQGFSSLCFISSA